MYLKKKKMYELLKEISQANLKSMKYATYQFYQGSEWLECGATDGEHVVVYKMYHERNFMSLDILKWNDEACEYKKMDRMTYHLQDGNWEKNYHRTEVDKEIEKAKRGLESMPSRRKPEVCMKI